MFGFNDKDKKLKRILTESLQGKIYSTLELNETVDTLFLQIKNLYEPSTFKFDSKTYKDPDDDDLINPQMAPLINRNPSFRSGLGIGHPDHDDINNVFGKSKSRFGLFK